MSFKDDFVEALRSVKRDFFREYEYTDKERDDLAKRAEDAASVSAASAPMEESVPATLEELRQPPVQPVQPIQPMQEAPPPTVTQPAPPPPPPAQDPADVMEAFRQASAIEDNDVYDAAQDADLDDLPGDTTPYRNLEPISDTGMVQGEVNVYDDGGRAYIDFGDNGLYDDDKTIISKNTVIRGAVETDDSIRLLGQVLGDIDCKANIVVAGKVRGNTSAANAYIFDAQVDGDVRCEDVITISNDAWVLGNLRAQQAEIDGKVKGNMEIRHMVSIGASSSILGDISTDELEIKRGAFVNGQIMMYSPSRDVLDRFDQFGDS